MRAQILPVFDVFDRRIQIKSILIDVSQHVFGDTEILRVERERSATRYFVKLRRDDIEKKY